VAAPGLGSSLPHIVADAIDGGACWLTEPPELLDVQLVNAIAPYILDEKIR